MIFCLSSSLLLSRSSLLILGAQENLRDLQSASDLHIWQLLHLLVFVPICYPKTMLCNYCFCLHCTKLTEERWQRSQMFPHCFPPQSFLPILRVDWGTSTTMIEKIQMKSVTRRVLHIDTMAKPNIFVGLLTKLSSRSAWFSEDVINHEMLMVSDGGGSLLSFLS